MKSNEYVMPELNGGYTESEKNVVVSKETFIHLIHTIRNQRFIETKPENEQKKRQAIIDKTYDWMLHLIAPTPKKDLDEPEFWGGHDAWVNCKHSIYVEDVNSIENCLNRADVNGNFHK